MESTYQYYIPSLNPTEKKEVQDQVEVFRATEPPPVKIELKTIPPRKPIDKKVDKTKWLIITGIIFILIIGGYLGATNSNLQQNRLCKSYDLIYDDRGFCYSPDGSETIQLHEIQKVNGQYMIAGK